jgi:hypothetical protein
MKPRETLLEVAERAFWVGQKDQEFRRVCQPGAFFLSLPRATRRQLKALTSDDLKNLRVDALKYMLGPPDQRYLQHVRAHYEAERRAYLKKHPYRSVDDPWEA